MSTIKGVEYIPVTAKDREMVRKLRKVMSVK